MKKKHEVKQRNMSRTKKSFSGIITVFLLSFFISGVGYAAEVKTVEELTGALSNKSVTDIEITSSITLKKDIKKIPNRDVTINGCADKDVVVNMGKYSFYGENSTSFTSQLKIQNANIIGDEVKGRFFTGGTGAKGVGWNILAENITYKGARFVHLSEGKLTFSGTNDIQTRAENAWVHHLEFLPNTVYRGEAATKDHGQFSVFYFNGRLEKGKAVGTVKIGENADVKVGIGSQSNVNYYYPVFYDKVYKVDVANNSKLEVNAAGVAFQFIPRADYFVEKKTHIGTGKPILNIGENSKVYLNGRGGGNYATMKLQYYGTEVNVNKGAELVVSGNSKKAVVESEYKGAIFNLKEPKNVEFENKMPGKQLFYSTNTKIVGENISEIKYWGKTGGDYQEAPQGIFNSNEKLLVDFGKCCNSQTLNVVASDEQTQNELRLENYGKISLKGNPTTPPTESLLEYLVWVDRLDITIAFKQADKLEIYEDGVLANEIDVAYSNVVQTITVGKKSQNAKDIKVKGYHNGELTGEG